MTRYAPLIALAALLALVSGAAMALNRGVDSIGSADASEPDAPDLDTSSWTDEPAPLDDAPMNYREHPLLLLIQRYESGGRYDILYGGGTFTGYADHPWGDLYEWRAGRVRRVDSPRWSQVPVIVRGANSGQRSTAAGRYQIMAATWVEHRDSWGIPDFAPDSQDKFAFLLLRQAGALRAYENGNYSDAIRKAARLWTSLPTSTTGEAQLSLTDAIAELKALS